MRIQTVQGDITKHTNVVVIVNAANKGILDIGVYSYSLEKAAELQ